MVEDKTSTRRRRLGAHGSIFRRRRIFARLRAGSTYEEIANEEGVTTTRIRQIVSAELQQRAVDSGAEHAKLQLERLASVMQLAAEAVAAGDVTAITPYLKVLDRFDRYQTVASANQVYDDEARKKLIAKVSRIAANLGTDEVIAATVRAHLKKIGEIPDDEPGEADGDGTDTASETEEATEARALETARPETDMSSNYFYFNPS
jgi:hypothetical protein